MFIQFNLRFHKKLLEALKMRASRENTPVNALAGLRCLYGDH